MKKLFLFLICTALCINLLSGCDTAGKLKYEKCIFSREEYYENWVVNNYEGVLVEIIESDSKSLTVKLTNQLDKDIEFIGYSLVYTIIDNVWYGISPAKETSSAEPDKEKTKEEIELNTVPSGRSKDFTCDFTKVYSGASLPEGNYRISISFSVPSPTKNNPEGKDFGKVLVDFEIKNS